jgi:hypothetical protein
VFGIVDEGLVEGYQKDGVVAGEAIVVEQKGNTVDTHRGLAGTGHPFDQPVPFGNLKGNFLLFRIESHAYLFVPTAAFLSIVFGISA